MSSTKIRLRMELKVKLQSACPSPDPDSDPDPDARLEKGTVPGPAVPTRRGPAWSCPEWQPGCTSPALLELLWHEARAPFQSTYSLNVYRLAVLAGLSTAHVFFILSFVLFCFLNIFYKKKKDFIQAIYKWISIIT
ncbi:unnamed protein product [Pipistrellus nathusii]|uniref:Uncharacterized protein n=1 Tax=Pipistrellus nathusii TaxID=59473 RepID=A0ABN9Z110_PIPNA